MKGTFFLEVKRADTSDRLAKAPIRDPGFQIPRTGSSNPYFVYSKRILVPFIGNNRICVPYAALQSQRYASILPQLYETARRVSIKPQRELGLG